MILLIYNRLRVIKQIGTSMSWNLLFFSQEFTSYSELITYIENNKHLENDKHVIFRLTELQNKLPTQLPHVSIY